MKLLFRQLKEKLKLEYYWYQTRRTVIQNFNFLLVFFSCIFLFCEVAILLDSNNKSTYPSDIIIISVLFGGNLLFYFIKRKLNCTDGVQQGFDMIIAIGSLEIYFSIDNCQGNRFILSLLQIQYILSFVNDKKQLTYSLIWLSFLYFSLRLILNIISYSSENIISISLTIFFVFSGIILAQYVEVIQYDDFIDEIDIEDGKKVKKNKDPYNSQHKYSHNMSTKSFLNYMHSHKKKSENFMKPSAENQLKTPCATNRRLVEDEIQLNYSHQIPTPILLGNSRQRDSDLESVLNSYRIHSNYDQVLKQSLIYDSERDKQQDLGTYQIGNQLNLPLLNRFEQIRKTNQSGSLANYNILSELSIGLIIIDDSKDILFSNSRSHQILKENNYQNLINILCGFTSSGFNKGSPTNKNQINKSHLNIQGKNAQSAQEIQLENKKNQKDKKQTQSISRMTSICLMKDKKDEELSPLYENKKKKLEQGIQNRKESSGRLYTSYKDTVNPSTTFHEKETKFTKVFSGNLNGADEKYNQDFKEENGIFSQRSQYGYKLSVLQDGNSSLNNTSKQNISNVGVEGKKTEIRRLNLNLNKELQSLIKQMNGDQINIKQVLDILLDSNNYQSFESNASDLHGYVKSKSEQVIDIECKQNLKKSDKNIQNKRGHDIIRGSSTIKNEEETDSVQEDTFFQSQSAMQQNYVIKDNQLIIKAQKENELIDLKISVLLEISLVQDAPRSSMGKQSGSGDTGIDIYPDKYILSNQRLDKFRVSIEEFKQQQIVYQNKEKGSNYFCPSIVYDTKKEKSKKKITKTKNNDVRIILLIEVYDKKEEMNQVNQEVFKEFKNKVLSSLSHELRTPLNCSLQNLETLFQSDLLNDNYKKLLVLPALNSNYLLFCMINDILDFAQYINGGLNLQFDNFNIINLLRECMSYFTLQAAYKNISMELYFEKNLPMNIRSDSMRIKQVIINLLSNALKFTQQGSISINVDLEEKDLIKISISDTGCGIPDEVGNLIFKGLEFNQNQANLNTEGAGMGLAIANNISKGLSGNRPIQFKSEINKGSTFSFFILDRPSKIKGCKSTKFTIFNRSFTNWKPQLQESSEKGIPSTIFDQINSNNNRIICSNTFIPSNYSAIPPTINLNQLQSSQHSQLGPQSPYVGSVNYPFVKSKTFSNTSLPQKSFNDFNSKIITYFNQINLQYPFQSSFNNFKNQEKSQSEEQIPSFNQIPKSFQDLSFAKNSNNLYTNTNNTQSNNMKYQNHTASQKYKQDDNKNHDNCSSIDFQNNAQNHNSGNIASEGNIKIDLSFENPQNKYQLEQQNIKKRLELYKYQQQQFFQTQSHQNNILKNRHINGGSQKYVEDGLASRFSCEIDTENSQIRSHETPQINQTHFIVAHKSPNMKDNDLKRNLFEFNNHVKQNYRDQIIQNTSIKENSFKSENHFKQVCLTDEPASAYHINQNRDDISNKQISPKQVHSMKNLLNDSFSQCLNETKQQKNTEEEHSNMITNQNQSNKNTNTLVQSSNSKNHVRIRDLEMDDIQTNLMYFLSLQQSSHISVQQNIAAYNSQFYNNINCSSPHNPSLLGNSFTNKSNQSSNLNPQQKNSTSIRQHESPRNLSASSHLYNQPYPNIQTNKLSKKIFQIDSQSIKMNIENSQLQSILNAEEARQRVDSVVSKKESINFRMENIIETHEHQEMDQELEQNQTIKNQKQIDENLQINSKQEMTNDDQYNNIINNKKILMNSNFKIIPSENLKQKIIDRNKQRVCSCNDVLIIDDNEFNLVALQVRLKQYGFLVETANSGVLGQQKVIQRHQQQQCCSNYTIIFMDLDMPVQNGFQTTTNILKYYKNEKAKPPIISACTAFVQDEEKRKAKQAGMKYYLTKPVETLSLEKVISNIIFQLN